MNLKAIKNKIFNGKNPKFIYYIRAYVMTHIPRALLRPALSKLDSIIEQRADRDYYRPCELLLQKQFIS